MQDFCFYFISSKATSECFMIEDVTYDILSFIHYHYDMRPLEWEIFKLRKIMCYLKNHDKQFLKVYK